MKGGPEQMRSARDVVFGRSGRERVETGRGHVGNRIRVLINWPVFNCRRRKRGGFAETPLRSN